jgi:membrane-associated phospholipid phosphatase
MMTWGVPMKSNHFKQLIVNRSFFLIVLLGGVFLLISHHYKHLVNIDDVVSIYIQDLRSDRLTESFIFITYLGSYYVSYPLVLICSIYCLVNKKILTGLFIFCNFTGVRYLNEFLKEYFSRERPGAEHLVNVSGLSFPSGHSMNSTAFLGFLAYLLWHYAKKSGRDVQLYLYGIILLILLIGMSRIYLGVHYPSDVIGGFAAGGVWLVISIVLFRHFVAQKERT